MNIYVLVEEREQKGYTDQFGEEAYPSAAIFGVYESQEKAEKELKALINEAEETNKSYGIGPLHYYIETRPLLK